MDWFVRGFIRSSVTWLAIGITLGLVMDLWPQFTVYRVAHLHINLVGFVSMMIFGVAYHVIPRFTGVPLQWRKGAGYHLYIGNAGLALLVLGFALRGARVPYTTALMAAGGIITAAGCYIFIFIIWTTLNKATPVARR